MYMYMQQYYCLRRISAFIRETRWPYAIKKNWHLALTTTLTATGHCFVCAFRLWLWFSGHYALSVDLVPILTSVSFTIEPSTFPSPFRYFICFFFNFGKQVRSLLNEVMNRTNEITTQSIAHWIEIHKYITNRNDMINDDFFLDTFAKGK